MHILVTNDDGFYAPGIVALAAALRTIPDAKVSVMAPSHNQSDAGHRKTLRDPLRIKPGRMDDGTMGIAISGSPADAIAVALLGYVKEKVDIVVSGINLGPNVAQDITYSGTVTAAMEATIAGVPAIAISLDTFEDPDFGPAAEFAVKLVPIVLRRGLPPLTLLNVNVPATPIKGLKITRQGHRIYHDALIERLDPEGKPYYWIGGERPGGHTEEIGTDVWAVAQGYISLTPIRLDMTNQALLADLGGWELWE